MFTENIGMLYTSNSPQPSQGIFDFPRAIVTANLLRKGFLSEEEARAVAFTTQKEGAPHSETKSRSMGGPSNTT